MIAQLDALVNRKLSHISMSADLYLVVSYSIPYLQELGN